LDDIGWNVPSGAGLIGMPSRLPTKNGCGWAGCGGGCCAGEEPAAIAVISAAAAVTHVNRFIDALLLKKKPGLISSERIGN
jgi:hypothetical protein